MNRNDRLDIFGASVLDQSTDLDPHLSLHLLEVTRLVIRLGSGHKSAFSVVEIRLVIHWKTLVVTTIDVFDETVKLFSLCQLKRY